MAPHLHCALLLSIHSIVAQSCNPQAGGDLAQPPRTGASPLNEPCYVHNGPCQGYPLCCVTFGTCESTHGGIVSSIANYYEGGCSREAANAETCPGQGECHEIFLQSNKGATTTSGWSEPLPDATVARLLVGATGDCASHVTICALKFGSDLAQPASASEPVNEPCYIQGGTDSNGPCQGYPLCCVTKGTCVSTHGGMLSSNVKYYEGGCTSPESRSGMTCPSVQGECNAPYLEFAKNATTVQGAFTPLDGTAMARLLADAIGDCSAYGASFLMGMSQGVSQGMPTLAAVMSSIMTASGVGYILYSMAADTGA